MLNLFLYNDQPRFLVQQGMPQLKAVIWDYYKVVDQDQRFACCLKCNNRISRGGKTGTSFNTTNMIDHLQKKHPVEYKKITKRKETKRVERTEGKTETCNGRNKGASKSVGYKRSKG